MIIITQFFYNCILKYEVYRSCAVRFIIVYNIKQAIYLSLKELKENGKLLSSIV